MIEWEQLLTTAVWAFNGWVWSSFTFPNMRRTRKMTWKLDADLNELREKVDRWL